MNYSLLVAVLLLSLKKKRTMNDEELRKFCLEQAVKLYQSRTTAYGGREMQLLDISDILYDYVRTGEKKDVPFSVTIYDKETLQGS